MTYTIPRTCKNVKEDKEKTLKEMLIKSFDSLKRGAPHPPNYIILYRKGGNQFQNIQLSQEEIPIFKSALESLMDSSEAIKKINPQFTYICCNLKSDLKFFEVEQGNPKGIYQNPKSGLCVDNGVTQKGKYEFFIQPQFVNQGCATPTHYEVMHIDQGMAKVPIEVIELLSFYLSFYYWTWAGAVRIPGLLKLASTAIEFYDKCLGNKLNYKDNAFDAPTYV